MKPDTGIDTERGIITREGARDGNPGFAPAYIPIYYTPWI